MTVNHANTKKNFLVQSQFLTWCSLPYKPIDIVCITLQICNKLIRRNFSQLLVKNYLAAIEMKTVDLYRHKAIGFL